MTLTAHKGIDKLIVFDAEGRTGEAWVQPCVSPVWDTCLMGHAMLEAGDEASVGPALDWTVERQITEVKGDWAWQRPDLKPGGWALIAFDLTHPHPGHLKSSIDQYPRYRDWLIRNTKVVLPSHRVDFVSKHVPWYKRFWVDISR